MKVKVHNLWYDSEDTPIMIILSKKDKENIMNMEKSATKYCSFPSEIWTPEEIRAWMRK